MSKLNIGEATVKLVDLLGAFSPDERHRIIEAARILMGDTEFQPVAPNRSSNGAGDFQNASSPLPARANSWLKQHEIEFERLEQIFHIDGDRIDIIAASIPGKSTKEQTLNSYILTGLAEFLRTGDASFQDKAARQTCKSLGCLNETNHASYIKDRGNKLTGSKEQGWKLTAPGLAHAAQLVKDLTPTK
jgi:hypothetical protein